MQTSNRRRGRGVGVAEARGLTLCRGLRLEGGGGHLTSGARGCHLTSGGPRFEPGILKGGLAFISWAGLRVWDLEGRSGSFELGWPSGLGVLGGS